MCSRIRAKLTSTVVSDANGNQGKRLVEPALSNASSS
jgi:hypothetical protein